MVFTTQTQRLAPHSADLHNVVFVQDAVSPRHTESLRPFLKAHDKGSSAGRLIREELNKLKLQRAAEIGIPRDALFPWELANNAGVKHQATSRARAGGVGHLYYGPRNHYVHLGHFISAIWVGQGHRRRFVDHLDLMYQ